ncbi:putative acyl esterase [Nitrobacteraceae bacterium AZCC 2146]
MIAEQDVLIPANDGCQLRANVYRPNGDGPFPVLMAMGIYGKDVHFADGYKPQWEKLQQLNPGICDEGSSGKFLRWEMIDPDRWVPDGYVVVHVDSRGSGKSPGYLDPFSPRETQDFYDAIEWAARMPWSTGKIGLIGISYLSIKQWQVAALRPPHLTAICPWEGGCDLYRDWSHHGGIFSNHFPTAWWPRQVLVNQNGNSETHHRDRETGEPTTGVPLNASMLATNRADHPNDLLRHSLDDEWYRERTPDLSLIEVPLFSSGNWGGAGLHLRGNIEGYVRSASKKKWLEIHVGTHFESFYLPAYVERQKRFFGHFLKGDNNGWLDEPKVRLEVRGPASAESRNEEEWPLARTQWQKYYLNCEGRTLSLKPAVTHAQFGYTPIGEGVTFLSEPFEDRTEFTGPLMARLWIKSFTNDLDVFATLRMISPDGSEVAFVGASDIEPVARGWLRASHRKIDETMSLPYRPYHAHNEVQHLEPGKPYPLNVEIWPTSIVFPIGYRMALTIQGCDYEVSGGAGRLQHSHPQDRPPFEFNVRNTILSGPSSESYLLLPFIPQRLDQPR